MIIIYLDLINIFMIVFIFISVSHISVLNLKINILLKKNLALKLIILYHILQISEVLFCILMVIGKHMFN